MTQQESAYPESKKQDTLVVSITSRFFEIL